MTQQESEPQSVDNELADRPVKPSKDKTSDCPISKLLKNCIYNIWFSLRGVGLILFHNIRIIISCGIIFLVIWKIVCIHGALPCWWIIAYSVLCLIVLIGGFFHYRRDKEKLQVKSWLEYFFIYAGLSLCLIYCGVSSEWTSLYGRACAVIGCIFLVFYWAYGYVSSTKVQNETALEAESVKNILANTRYPIAIGLFCFLIFWIIDVNPDEIDQLIGLALTVVAIECIHNLVMDVIPACLVIFRANEHTCWPKARIVACLLCAIAVLGLGAHIVHQSYLASQQEVSCAAAGEIVVNGQCSPDQITTEKALKSLNKSVRSASETYGEARMLSSMRKSSVVTGLHDLLDKDAQYVDGHLTMSETHESQWKEIFDTASQLKEELDTQADAVKKLVENQKDQCSSDDSYGFVGIDGSCGSR
ncbi:hypothetical protein [Bifidobacterium simiiventris]|uniref:hypothetical protein n=1 Tax=Bifidobacterium simiiventris TaxID=2834434 RepID=UPI001C572CEB|nr:hypothetical protein [Bifidobacterium simiiventris]MBW3078097.1 hypothetical protein [Bifidobacterium simiiventris]